MSEQTKLIPFFASYKDKPPLRAPISNALKFGNKLVEFDSQNRIDFDQFSTSHSKISINKSFSIN